MKTNKKLVYTSQQLMQTKNKEKTAHAQSMNAKLWLQSRMMPDEIYDTDSDFKKIVDGVEGLARREVYHTSAVHMAEMLGLDKAEEEGDGDLVKDRCKTRSVKSRNRRRR